MYIINNARESKEEGEGGGEGREQDKKRVNVCCEKKDVAIYL